MAILLLPSELICSSAIEDIIPLLAINIIDMRDFGRFKSSILDLLNWEVRSTLLYYEDCMKDKLVEMLNLKPGEVKLAFSLWLLIAVNTLVLELSDVVATAGFVSNVGVYRIPWLWIVTTLITIFAAGGYLVVVDRYPRLHLVLGLLVGLAVVYLLLEFLFAFKAPDWLTYPALYLLADQAFGFLGISQRCFCHVRIKTHFSFYCIWRSNRWPDWYRCSRVGDISCREIFFWPLTNFYSRSHGSDFQCSFSIS